MTSQVSTSSVLKAQVSPALLKGALERVRRAVPTKETEPVMKCVRITSDGQGLRLATTDFEISLQERVPALVTESGDICVPARTLMAVLSQVPRTVESVHLHSDDAFVLNISWGDSAYDLYGYDPDGFPQPLNVQPDGTVMVGVGSLRRALERTLWSAGEVVTKPWMSGVRLTVGGSWISAVACNGVTIGRSRIPVVSINGALADLILPGPFVKAIIQACKRTTEAAAMLSYHQGPDGVSLLVEVGTSVIASRTLQGQYPDVERLVPADYPVQMQVRRAALLGALKRLLCLSGGGTTRWEISPDRDLRIVTQAPTGSAVERFPGVQAQGLREEMVISFNARFWVSALSTWDCERVQVEFRARNSPARVVPVDATEQHDAIILPLITY